MASVFRRLTRSRSNAAPAASGSDEQGGEEAADGGEGGEDVVDAALAASIADECHLLLDMGFDQQRAADALEASGGDVSEAIVALLSSMTPGPEEGAQGPRRQESQGAEQLSVEELDAVLDEALKASEQEAELERQRKEDEQRALDAALAASLECMGPGPSFRADPPGKEGASGPQLQLVRGPAKERSPADAHTSRQPAANGEISEKVLSASARRQQLEPLRPLRHREKEVPSSSSRSQSSHNLLAGLQPQVGVKGLAPSPLQEVRSQQDQHFPRPRGTPTRHHQEFRSSAPNSRPVSSSTGIASNPGGAHGGEELVALDDLEGWNRGSGLFGVASLRSTYPARLLPVTAPRHQQQQPLSTMPPQWRSAQQEVRPSSRAARQGLGNSNSSPLLAAAALSIS
mmetsp:Transcript_35064/g.95046  ORF Transcript_35064/g.95046 Transcript_35064/m.95046 type:complete len:401 (-) Transcript_35064:61-1263(-)